MRNTFFKELQKVAALDKDTYLLTANLGFKLFDDFKASCPDQFIDVGVAEANMIGLASGMALSGKNVYCYSIIPFLVMRAYEQIRVDVAYHDLNVKLVGVGGGFTYGLEGFTHFGIEDLALMRALPYMNIVVPSDPLEAEQVVRAAHTFSHPLYIRLGRAGDPQVHDASYHFQMGKGDVVRDGSDVTVFAIGNMVYQAKKAADLLANDGISVKVVNMHTLKPLDVDLIRDCARSSKAIFSVEEHSVIGGLGSAVAEVLAEHSYHGFFRRIGIPETFGAFIGHGDFLREQHGLTSSGIRHTIVEACHGRL